VQEVRVLQDEGYEEKDYREHSSVGRTRSRAGEESVLKKTVEKERRLKSG
jgi:hypothetical protein